MDTLTFRQQHASLLKLGIRLDQEARVATDPRAVTAVLATLARFTEELSEHLEAEDGQLYPAMMASDDPELSAMAKDYFAEMGGITDLFHLYRARWTSAAIIDNPLRFARETRLLIDGLVDRIRRENETLYPAAERVPAKAA